MKNIMENKKAFSFLEIVVIVWITLLIINIGFSYYKIQLKNSRDSQRISSIWELKIDLANTLTKGNLLPEPIWWINITSSWETINTQWYITEDMLELQPNLFIDPLDSRNYTYTVNKEKDRFQLLWLLENNWNEKNNVNYNKRLPYTAGNDLWMFLRVKDNTPVQEYEKNDIKINDNLNKYIVYINNDTYAIWKNIKKEINFRINPIANCLHILKNGNSKGDWVYRISPDMMNSFDVYCDMTTDWWWWTLFYANNWIEDSPIAESYIEMRQNVMEWKVYDLTDFTGATLAGLKDYRYFTNNWATEILIKNNTVSENKWWKIFFSSPNTLEWALWDKVLWTGIEKCIDLPKWSSWWIVDELWTNSYSNLTQMMAHWWTNWWISHEKYDCNWYVWESILPHVAFYSANDNNYVSRARSNLLIWWTWWWENQYRYFIR